MIGGMHTIMPSEQHQPLEKFDETLPESHLD